MTESNNQILVSIQVDIARIGTSLSNLVANMQEVKEDLRQTAKEVRDNYATRVELLAVKEEHNIRIAKLESYIVWIARMVFTGVFSAIATAIVYAFKMSK